MPGGNFPKPFQKIQSEWDDSEIQNTDAPVSDFVAKHFSRSASSSSTSRPQKASTASPKKTILVDDENEQLAELKARLVREHQDKFRKLEASIEYFKRENARLEKGAKGEQASVEAERKAMVAKFDEEQEKLRKERAKLNQERERHRQAIGKEKKDIESAEGLQTALEKGKKEWREKETSLRNQTKRLQSQVDLAEKELQQALKDVEWSERKIGELTETAEAARREVEELREELKLVKREKDMDNVRLREEGRDVKIEKVVRETRDALGASMSSTQGIFKKGTLNSQVHYFMLESPEISNLY